MKCSTLESTIKASFCTHTAVIIGTPSSFQLRMNSRSSSIFTCWMSLLKFSSVVPVGRQHHHSENVNFFITTVNDESAEMSMPCTSKAENVEQHSSDLVLGAVWVEQYRQQGPHGILHLYTFHIWAHSKVLHRDTILNNLKGNLVYRITSMGRDGGRSVCRGLGWEAMGFLV